MQPFLELAKLWPYLPHFRIVAEYESLSRASRRFGLSSAALSKAIRVLEKSLELELFDRAGGKLRLNDHGRALLGVTRDAMRDLDDVIAAMRGAATPHAVRVALDSAWGSLIVPASHASGDVELLDAPDNVLRALLRADADVVFHTEPLSHNELDSIAFATFERAVCVVSSLAVPARVTRDELQTLAFAALRNGDGWPLHVPRRIVFTTSSLAHALAAAASGACATVAPVALAAPLGLRVLAVADLAMAPLTLWATVRRARRGSTSSALRWRDSALAGYRAPS